MELLLTYTNPLEGRPRATLLRGVVAIGRELPPGLISLGSKTIADRHAEIDATQRVPIVRQVDASCAVFVNGVLVDAAHVKMAQATLARAALIKGGL